MADMCHPRESQLVLSRPFVFVPYTGVEPQSGEPLLLLPTLNKDGKTVVPAGSRVASNSYVYIYVTAKSFEQLSLHPSWCEQSVPSGVNPLYAVFRASSTGLKRASVPDVLTAAKDAKFPALSDAEKVAQFELDARLRHFAIGSPVPLTDVALKDLETLAEDQVPHLDLLAGDFFRYDGDGPDAVFALPVLDPVAMTTSLTKKYYRACDLYLSYTQTFAKPTPAQLRSEMQEGQFNLLRKGVADTLQGLRRVTDVDGEINVGELERFLKQYTEHTQFQRDERENAALVLINWLEGPWMTRAETWGRRSDGSLDLLIPDSNKPSATVYPYQFFIEAVGNAQGRLTESDTGVAYLSQTYERVKNNGDKPGVLRALGTFVLSDVTPPADVANIARKTSLSLFAAWTAYYEVGRAHFAAGTRKAITINRKTQTITGMREYTSYMMRHLSKVVGDEIVEFERSKEITLRVPFRTQITTKLLDVDLVQLRLVRDAKAKLAATNLTLGKAQAAFAVINIGLTYSSLREALDKRKIDASAWVSAFDLAESVVFFADQMKGSDSLRRMRKQLVNIPSATSLVSTRLGLLGAALSLGGSAVSALNRYNSHDWDAAAADATQGIGAAFTAAGYVVVLKSPGGGPAAGYFLAAGVGISTIGFVWSLFAADTPYDQLAKFSAFGDEVGAAAPAPGWAQCTRTGTFADWAPHTKEGLKRQLKAAEQLFYSFRASGMADIPRAARYASDALLRIYPSAVRPNTVVHIWYEAQWVHSATRKLIAPKATGLCVIEMGTPSNPDRVRLRDLSGRFKEEGAVALGQVDGANVLDVVLQLKHPPRTLSPPWTIHDLTFFVQLDVHGDSRLAEGEMDASGSVIVPTTDQGARWLEVRCLKAGEARRVPVASYDDEVLGSPKV